MSEKMQFDSFLGGNVELPSELRYMKFAAARCKEIEIMTKMLSSDTSTKLAFQKLPKHMRRRAMSHNIKRLPRRLRQIHMNQVEKSGIPQKQKKSRRFKRKPSNIFEEYARRQQKTKWLNTHIWHAKRFHMVKKWGYKLPDRPCDKSFRACYRATTSHCLLQDISYYSCIELEGNYNILIEKFKLITDNSLDISIGAKAFNSGKRESSITLFTFNSEVKRAIGVVNFIWKPSYSKSHIRNLWLWVHAAFYNELLENLIKLFELEEIDMETKGFSKQHINDQTKVMLLELKFELSRFRLTGPLSNTVLQRCFKITDVNNFSENAPWFQNYIDDNQQRQIFTHQKNTWEYLKTVHSSSEISPHSVISVIVEDPRLNFPSQRTKAMPYTGLLEYDESICEISDLPFSALWDNNIRKSVNESKINNTKIIELRSNNLVPGTDIEDASVRMPVPILLIQRPGCRKQHIGYGSGWDLILPASYSQPIWLALIMWGARAGGLRETNLMDFEMGKPHFLLPDTDAGKKEEYEEMIAQREAYFRKPPNRRTNFTKFSITCPFELNWKMLVKEWKQSQEVEIEDFYVVRDKKILKNLQIKLENKKIDLEESILLENCLIPVNIKCTKKGLPTKYAIICLPQAGDIKNNIEPVEEKKIDKNEQLRKKIRKEHKALLKRLRQRRIRSKKKGKILPTDKENLEQYRSKMRKLWLPEVTNIKDSCSRKIIGFVTKGDFSFSLGQSFAVGYITVDAFPEILKTGCNKILIRNTSSRQYRFGTISVGCA